jgi:hypothetical protein
MKMSDLLSRQHLGGEEKLPEQRITQKYLRRYPDSKRTRKWFGKLVHIETDRGIWRPGGCGYTSVTAEAWFLLFEDAVRMVKHCGQEKKAAFIRANVTPAQPPEEKRE